MRHPRDHLSQRAVGVKQSAVRDVFDIAMDPNLVSLAGGNPWLADLPLDELGRVASDLMTRFGTESLQYGPGQGTEEMRAAATAVMAADGIPDADPDLVVITPGSQAAIDTACRAFADPGDVVVVGPGRASPPAHRRGLSCRGCRRPGPATTQPAFLDRLPVGRADRIRSSP